MSIRKLGIGGLATVLWVAVLAVVALPALAVAPEEPVEVSVSPVKATEATFHGFLNPAAPEPVAAGTYEFLYKESPTECEGGSKAPASSPAISKGNPREEVSETVTGLEAGKTYTVCLLARNGTKVGENEVLSTPVTFTTATPAEKPETKAATGVTATTATLHGVLDPKAEAETGWYFVYSTGAECTSGGAGGGETGHEAPAKVKALSIEREVAGLEPNKTYKFCLVATDTAEEPTVGNELSFVTPALAATEEGLTASAVTPYGASLEAQVNAENEPTECKFEYGPTPGVKLEKEVACEQGVTPGTLEGYGNQTASVNVKLASDTTFYYRLIVKNATGKAEAESQLKTLAVEKPTVADEAVSGVTSTEGTLEAQVNPNYQKVECNFRYWLDEGEDPEDAALTVPCEPASLEGFGEQRASVLLTGLEVGKTYSYRAVLKNETNDEVIEGRVQSVTPVGVPLVGTSAAQNVSEGAAMLPGTINPAGSATSYHVAYISRAGYEAGVAANPANPFALAKVTLLETGVPAGYEAVPVQLPVMELTAGTTYEYELVATNSTGTTVGSPAAFTTTGAPPVENTGGEAEIPGPAPQASPFPAATLPPVIPYTSISALDAKEAKEGKASTPVTKSLTRAQKLSKALKVCQRKPKKQRAGCETAAHHRYGPAGTKKKKK